MNEKDIRGALDRRLSALEASPARRERIRRATEKEVRPVKKVFRTALILALMAALTIGGAAVASSTRGLNVFALFGRFGDPIYADISEHSTIYNDEPVWLDVDGLGRVEVSLTCSYFDGTRVELGCAMADRALVELYTPTEEDKALLKPRPEPQYSLNQLTIESLQNPEFKAVQDACQAAVDAGEPCGYRYIRLDSEQYCLNAETGEKHGWTERSFFYTDEGIFSLICHAPLETPSDAQSMRITVPFRLMESFYWFDGETWYYHVNSSIIHEQTILVTRTDNP